MCQAARINRADWLKANVSTHESHRVNRCAPAACQPRQSRVDPFERTASIPRNPPRQAALVEHVNPLKSDASIHEPTHRST